MATENVINYTPPPILRAFIKDYLPGELFYDWIVGPVGSGKTTAIFFKLVRMAKLQKPGPDGIRKTRAVIVRNTMPQLRDTTLSSWNYWFKDGQAGQWIATSSKFVLRFDDVECEVLFRPLDTAEDVARVLSLEVTFAILDEFVQIKREIVDALSARLGRYPSAKDGGATNWGMWGSSNPDTEDNWWFSYLHNSPDAVEELFSLDEDVQAARWALKWANHVGKRPNAKYFKQPSGLGPDAENIDNLPGGADYYINQARGKSETWVKQFLEAEWGYSVSGKPVVPSFKADLHVSKGRLKFQHNAPLVIGLDPGLGGSALIFGQEDLHGRLLVLGELIQENMGAERIITERLKPYVRRHFPQAELIFAPDPAANNRAQTDEKSIVDVFKKHFPGRVKIETNNRLAKRFDAIEHFTTRLTDVGPALLIDEVMCPTVIRALKGGWKFIVDTKRDIPKPEPDKNAYSHPGDAFGYLCRYFHRNTERGIGYGPSAQRFVAPRSFGPNYHMT